MDFNLDCFKQTLIEKLALLLFLNSETEKELMESKSKILDCYDLTKEEIIDLIELEEKVFKNWTKKQP